MRTGWGEDANGAQVGSWCSHRPSASPGSRRYISAGQCLGAAAAEPALDLAVLDLGLERAVVTTVLGAVPGRQPEG